jgi:hypothetical protein
MNRRTLLYLKCRSLEVSLINPQTLPNSGPLKSALYTTDANRVSAVAEPRVGAPSLAWLGIGREDHCILNKATMLSLGFLTVVEHETWGLIGGLLVLNANARPLEFHCTAPLKPNRAQQILYGATLEPYLYGEQIGQTLVGKVAAPLTALFCEKRASLATRDFCDVPTAWVVPSSDVPRLRASNELHLLNVAEELLTLSFERANDAAAIEATLTDLPRKLDLREPFGRIQSALDEAQKSSRAA